MNAVLIDSFEKTLNPICTLKPLFAVANGIFSDIERIMAENPSQIEVRTSNDENIRNLNFYKDFFTSMNISTKISYVPSESFSPITPDMLLKNFPVNLLADLKYLKREKFSYSKPLYFEGNKTDVWIHNEASVSPMAAINTTNGPVIIDQNVKVSPFSILNGPLYIGPESILERVSISNSRSGKQCRLGGEISDTLIGNYTNKHHEGFLGHSIVGDWVNLGALTTTSDLKNNYGEIRLEYSNEGFSTNRIKFGSIIGDYVKTGIGSMLNTGTILDVGTLLYQDFPVQKYYPRFFWGGGKPAQYKIDRFLSDMEKIMARRKCIPDIHLKNQIQYIYNR